MKEALTTLTVKLIFLCDELLQPHVFRRERQPLLLKRRWIIAYKEEQSCWREEGSCQLPTPCHVCFQVTIGRLPRDFPLQDTEGVVLFVQINQKEHFLKVKSKQKIGARFTISQTNLVKEANCLHMHVRTKPNQSGNESQFPTTKTWNCLKPSYTGCQYRLGLDETSEDLRTPLVGFFPSTGGRYSSHHSWYSISTNVTWSRIHRKNFKIDFYFNW